MSDAAVWLRKKLVLVMLKLDAHDPVPEHPKAGEVEPELRCGRCGGDAHRVVDGAARWVECTHGCGWRGPWPVEEEI